MIYLNYLSRRIICFPLRYLNVALVVLVICCQGSVPETQVQTTIDPETPAIEVLSRLMGEQSKIFQLQLISKEAPDTYSIDTHRNKVHISANSVTALCRGAYDYLRNNTNSIVSWTGNRFNIPSELPSYTKEVYSPFQYRFYLNTVTHGYSTPYWDWERWEQEIDWMAVHGMNMPLLPGAHEAILLRTFRKIGLTEVEIADYFSGPAHFPWNRMGNIGGWDGPPPHSFYEKQIDLTHKILRRLKELQMQPIIHAFAGFVPRGIKRLYPQENLRELGWGGFQEKVHILAPNSELFKQIGTAYIQEWEAEFGEGRFYLADSFNEMDVPLSPDIETAKSELAEYGQAVYAPIVAANPNAVWVMQGWTFPYHRDPEGNLFWTPERLKAMMSKIPDNKLLILDMANEYNALFWDIDYSWEMYQGFFGKQWIYSFIPNMGGKTSWNGVLDFYATAPKKALNFQHNQSLVGFGFAPEGIENNDVIYELLSDWGWANSGIDLDKWLEDYCQARYGGYPDSMKIAWELLRKSALGSFTDHPRFRFQFRPEGEYHSSVHQSLEFNRAVKAFLSCSKFLERSNLYQADALELGTQLLGHRVDSLLHVGMTSESTSDQFKCYQEAIDLMRVIDRLLASHPTHQLSMWVNQARSFGDSVEEKEYYESNAKRLITTWGGEVNEYSARVWSGLVGSYYAERWAKWLSAKRKGKKFDVLAWEEDWISTPWKENSKPFTNPLDQMVKLIE